MKQVFSESDVHKLVGKFVVKLHEGQEDWDITKTNKPNFWLEKRIFFIAMGGIGNSMSFVPAGLFYSLSPKDTESFIKWVNLRENGRFVRLLKKKELRWLFEKMYEIQCEHF